MNAGQQPLSNLSNDYGFNQSLLVPILTGRAFRFVGGVEVDRLSV